MTLHPDLTAIFVSTANFLPVLEAVAIADSERVFAEFYRTHGKLAAAIPFFEKAYQSSPADYANAWDLCNRQGPQPD